MENRGSVGRVGARDSEDKDIVVVLSSVLLDHRDRYLDGLRCCLCMV